MTLIAVAPINAPTRTREALRIIACLSSILQGPPWPGIDRFSIFSKFNVKRWPVGFQRQCSRTRHSFFAHCSQRLASKDKLALACLDGVHSGENHVVTVARVE